MADYVCIAQQGQTSERMQGELTAGLEAIAAEVFGETPERVEVAWISVREGFGFTAGAPSTSTLVARAAPIGYPQALRESLMTRICDLWTNVTGCSRNEIVVTVIDGPLPF